MEAAEVGVDFERGVQGGEGGREGDGEAGPHVLGDGFEGAGGGVDLGVEGGAAGGAAAVGVEEDVSGVLEEDGAVEVCWGGGDVSGAGGGRGKGEGMRGG